MSSSGDCDQPLLSCDSFITNAESMARTGGDKHIASTHVLSAACQQQGRWVISLAVCPEERGYGLTKALTGSGVGSRPQAAAKPGRVENAGQERPHTSTRMVLTSKKMERRSLVHLVMLSSDEKYPQWLRSSCVVGTRCVLVTTLSPHLRTEPGTQ